jgi:hypothetical protein
VFLLLEHPRSSFEERDGGINLNGEKKSDKKVGTRRQRWREREVGGRKKQKREEISEGNREREGRSHTMNLVRQTVPVPKLHVT